MVEPAQQQVIEEEEVEHEWLDEHPIEEVVIAQDGNHQEYVDIDEHMMQQHMPIEYEEIDSYPSLLPVRDGIPLLTLNLPDLMSKTISFTNGEKMSLCFNKRCQRQVAFEGFLYTVVGYVSESMWNVWTCVNPLCDGSIRSSPSFQELRVRTDHSVDCLPDEIQIRLRVAVYDLRLMAEFTDLSLDMLHAGFESRMKADNQDIGFPSFDSLKNTLEDHRVNKIYRKRFEMQALKDKQKKMNMTPDEVVFAESTSGLVRFKRTKPFPPSICYDCGEQMTTGTLPSQDQLIAHLLYNHHKQLMIERFEFKDLSMFEQYIRELNIYSRYKMKRMGLADENMYFLCLGDDRLNKTGNGRAGKAQEQIMHCTAFIRVFDWRHVNKREATPVTIDYCMEHSEHVHHHNVAETSGAPREDLFDVYSPEVFVREIEDRRLRTQKLLEDSNLQRIKRPLEVRSVAPLARVRPSFGTRALAPPIAAQLAGGNANPFVDTYFSDDASDHRKRYKVPIRMPPQVSQKKEPTAAEIATSSAVEQQQQPVYAPPINYNSRGRITERCNFRDIYTYNAVVKVEDACNTLIQKLQTCQYSRVAMGYKEKIGNILRKANSDDSLKPNSTTSDIEKSWVIVKPVRGRPPKRREDERDDVMMKGEADPENQNDEDEVTKKVAGLKQEFEEEELDEEEEPTGSIAKKPRLEEEPEFEEVVVEVEEEEEETLIERQHEEDAEKIAEDASFPGQAAETRSGRQRKTPARLVEEQ